MVIKCSTIESRKACIAYCQYQCDVERKLDSHLVMFVEDALKEEVSVVVELGGTVGRYF